MKSGSKLYDCLKWGKQFKKKMSLNKHRITKHHEDLPDVKTFSCEHCGKLFLDSRDFKEHIKTHTGEKSFVCDVCSKAFSTSSNLKIHSTIHTGETRFKCSVCSHGFRQLIQLKNHMLKKHEMEYKPPSPPTLQTPVKHHSVPYIPFVRTISQVDNLSGSLVSKGSGSQLCASSELNHLKDSKPFNEFTKPPPMSTIPCAEETLPFSCEEDNEELCKENRDDLSKAWRQELENPPKKSDGLVAWIKFQKKKWQFQAKHKRSGGGKRRRNSGDGVKKAGPVTLGAQRTKVSNEFMKPPPMSTIPCAKETLPFSGEEDNK